MINWRMFNHIVNMLVLLVIIGRFGEQQDQLHSLFYGFVINPFGNQDIPQYLSTYFFTFYIFSSFSTSLSFIHIDFPSII